MTDPVTPEADELREAAQAWADGKSVMFDSDVRLVEAVNAALAAFDSLAAQLEAAQQWLDVEKIDKLEKALEAAQREAQENFEAMMEERDRAIAAQKEYGLRAAKRQLKKDNASLVEQNLALRSKVSVLAAQLEAAQGAMRSNAEGWAREEARAERLELQRQTHVQMLDDAQKVIEAARRIEQLDRAGHDSEVAAEMGYIARKSLAAYDARALPSSQTPGHTEAS